MPISKVNEQRTARSRLWYACLVRIAIFLSAAAFFIALAPPSRAQDLATIEGTYRREPVQNDWHVGTIKMVRVGNETRLKWRNRAGVEWGLRPVGNGILETDSSNPYFKSGAKEFRLRMKGSEVLGFTFQSDLFVKEGVTLMSQRSGGFHGYISAGVESPPDAFRFGASFYVSIWPLVTQRLTGFQIGLPSTWIIPDNRDFQGPLCPPGTVARDNWPERGPYYRDVFQTIEGGLGYWGSTRFKSLAPKYRINGTPNGYTHEISSPGWGFGRTSGLEPEQMGIAQLSNRLLLPPDGITFEQTSRGELLGNAWMPLQLTGAVNDPQVPTGDQSWTLFLNSANFKGPVAFYIPQTWSRLSLNFRSIVGRGLDARPAQMQSSAMEVNTVPFFEARDRLGNTYSRIPRIQFPVDSQGVTRLMQDITFYGKGAARVPGLFDARLAWKPKLTANPIRFDQGPEKTPLTGFEGHVQTLVMGGPESQAFGLQWRNVSGEFASLPEFFKEAGDTRMPVAAALVPRETQLHQQEFNVSKGSGAYTSSNSGVWRHPGPASNMGNVVLNDGSVVTYAWYRFVDQPSFRAFEWSDAERERVQRLVERMHAQWPIQRNYIPPPSEGRLVKLDRAVLVSPPPNLGVGYVPIAISQQRPSSN